MKITVSQQGKKLSVTFKRDKAAGKFIIAKADNFLIALDKFLKKRKMGPIRPMEFTGSIEFRNVSLLTERVIRAIMLGLSF